LAGGAKPRQRGPAGRSSRSGRGDAPTDFGHDPGPRSRLDSFFRAGPCPAGVRAGPNANPARRRALAGVEGACVP